MNETPKNREWVKNAAIVFLAVLLVLTFFSNTIMNRSLPEAAAVYVQSGVITAMVRGQGTVESLGSYEVKAPETREIRAVMIRAGQEVEAGDVLFVLGNGDSAEIEAAQEQLRQLELNYSQTAAGSSNYSGKLKAAQNRYNKAVAAEAEAYAQLTGNPDYQSAITALDAAKADLAAAELNYKLAGDTALQSLDSLIAVFGDFTSACAASGLDTLSLNDAQYSLNNARASVAAADSSLNTVAAAVDMTDSAARTVDQFSLVYNSEISSDADLTSKLFSLNTCFDQTMSYLSDDSRNNDLTDCVSAKIDAIERSNSAQNLYDGFSGMFSEEYENAVTERKTAEAALKALQESASDYSQQAALTGITLQDLKYQIERAQEKLDKLTGGADNQILSNVSGTVSSVSVNAGTTASKDQVLAVIDVPDMGYTLSYSVTNDQAQRLHIGDTATVTSYYWGSRIDATLTAIKPDQKEPQSKRILEFDVTGDVSPGAQLTISIGARSQNYDLIVPNSAIRSDSNGKFVLAVDARNSALGNRYFARRVDVEIIANDDNNSAVTGALNYGDFVITTTSAPLKSGEQFRMAEG